jgi:hypothetical protein
MPFIAQDEWRIVVLTGGYLADDTDAPIKINVDTSNFYPYCTV